MTFEEILVAWIFAFFSIAILSYLWKINIVYKIAESLATAAYTVHWFIGAWTSSVESACFKQIASGNLMRIIPLILGLLLFARLSKKYSWLSRYPVGLLAGVGIGVLFGATFDAQILTQISMTINAFTEKDILSGVVILIGVISMLSYFLYTHEHKGFLGISAKIGRIFAMFSFGMNYSAEMIWYLTILVGIMVQLINVWIKGAILGI